MNALRFRTGVSNWTLDLDNDAEIIFKEVISESVTLFADGKVVVKLSNATFDIAFIDYFMDNIGIKRVNQFFELKDSEGNVTDGLDYNYYDMTIKKVVLISKTDSFGVVNVIFASKKK